MDFEITIRNTELAVNVTELKDEWTVSLTNKSTNNTEVHHVMKWDYQTVDDAVSFLFENTSYMMGLVNDGIKCGVYTRGSYREMNIFNDEMLLHESLKAGGSLTGSQSLISGMPGKIVDILVKPGEEIKANQPVLIMEAMKMENEMKATQDTVVKEVLVKVGESVESGATLIVYGE